MGGSPSQPAGGGASGGASQPFVMPEGNFGSTPQASPTFQIGGGAQPAPSGTFGVPTGKNPFQAIYPQQTQTMANAALAQPGGANPMAGMDVKPGQVPPGQVAQVAALLSGVKPTNTGQTPEQLRNMVESILKPAGYYA